MGHADQPLHASAALRSADALSLAEYWMPFTPNRDFKRDPKMVVRAEGMYSRSAMTLGSFMVRVGDRTSCSYSLSTETRSRNTAFTASCQDQSDNG